MNYNLDLVNQSTSNLLQAITVVNDASGHVFGTLLIISIGIGYYFLFSKEQKIDDLLTSSFITCIIATLFLIAEIITFPIFTGFWTLFLVTFVLKWYL